MKFTQSQQQQQNDKNEHNESDKENEINIDDNSSFHILDIVPKLQIFDDDEDNYNEWQNGIDFVATLSGTDGELSDFEDERLLNKTICTQLYDDDHHSNHSNHSNQSELSDIITTQRSRSNTNRIPRNAQIIDLT